MSKPVQSVGEKAALKARKICNNLSDQEREELLDATVRLIYGGDNGKAKAVRR